MADPSGLLMLVGAATPPGRLATAIAAAAEMARSRHADLAIDILNLADTPVEICDGRPLDGYGPATRHAARADAPPRPRRPRPAAARRKIHLIAKIGAGHETAAVLGETPAALARTSAQTGFRGSRGAGQDQSHHRQPELPPRRSRSRF